MTESEWLACTNPTPMLGWLGTSGMATDRKLRLFAFACCSRIWRLLPDEGRRVVLATEGYAEGRATRHERDAAVAAFRKAHGRYAIPSPLLRAGYHTKEVSFDPFTAASVARDAAGAACGLELAAGQAQPDEFAESPALATERAAQAALLRDLFGPLPFRPVAYALAWLTPTVRNLATAAYDNRTLPAGTLEPERLAVLADALEDAGCNKPDLLGHLRGPGPHARGCWAVDLLLGKE